MKNRLRAAGVFTAALLLPLSLAAAEPQASQWNTTLYLQFDFGGRAADTTADSFKLGLSGNLLSLESRLEAARAAVARFNPQAFRATPAGLLQVELQPARPLNNALRIGGMDVLQRAARLNEDGAAAPAEASHWYSGATGWILAGGAVLIGLVAVAGNEAEDLGYGAPDGPGADFDGPNVPEGCLIPLGETCIFGFD